MKYTLYLAILSLVLINFSQERSSNQDFNFNFDETKHTQECQAKCQDEKRDCFKKCRKEFTENKEEKWVCQEQCTNKKAECEQKCEKDTESLSEAIKQMTKKSCEDQMLKCVQDCSQYSNIEACLPKCKKVKDECEKESQKRKKTDL